jgi:dienelactone hydrolase
MTAAFSTSLFAALVALALALPATAQQAVTFPAARDYANKPVTLAGDLMKPAGDGPFPAVVLMHGCSGLQPSVAAALTSHARQLVDNGFVALVLDSFGPRDNGGGAVCKSLTDLSEARNYRVEDALQAKAYLAALPFVDGDNIFQMGQSNGGSVALKLAQLDPPEFRALASYYPWCGAFKRFGDSVTLTAPLIVFGGAADDWVPPTACTTATAQGADYKVIIYPEATHSFDLNIEMQRFSGHLVGYNAPADRDSRAQMAAFFKSHLTKAAQPAQLAPLPAFLSGAEISKLMPTGQLKGVNGYGNPYTITYAADGSMSGVAGAGDEYTDTGKWWVKGDMFCRQYKSWLGGAQTCFRVILQGETINWHDEDGGFVSADTFAR